MSIEEVVLVDEKNNILGTMPKFKVHQKETPLHRAFSVFLFNKEGELLIQQRSHKKKTWPLVWSNSCCGHPGLDESNVEAAKRRIKDELGVKVDNIQEVAYYRYKFSKDGIMENEICPILKGVVSGELNINKDEVESVKWIKWDEFLKEIENPPAGGKDKYSPWCIEQTKILNKKLKTKNE
jgi:isopentenyl-diphosphate delta-isomerase